MEDILLAQIMSGQFGLGTIKNAIWETPDIYFAKEHERHSLMEQESAATETVRAQQEASQRSYDVSRPSGGVSLSQGPFGRSQRVIGRNPSKVVSICRRTGSIHVCIWRLSELLRWRTGKYC